MQQLVFQFFVAIHGQDHFTCGTNNASGALDNSTAKCFDLAETPKRRTFGCGPTSTGCHLNLQFAGEIMRENPSEHIQLTTDTRGLDNLESVSLFSGSA